MIKTITPIDNSLLVERKFANENEIEVALENSLNARNVWREESLDTRIKYLKNFVKLFLSNQNEITQSLCNSETAFGPGDCAPGPLPFFFVLPKTKYW